MSEQKDVVERIKPARMYPGCYFDILTGVADMLRKAEGKNQKFTCEESVVLDANGNFTDGREFHLRIDPTVS